MIFIFLLTEPAHIDEENLKAIESIIKSLIYSPEKGGEKSSIMALRTIIDKTLLIIPGYFENIRIIKYLNSCLIELDNVEINSSGKRRETTFNEIKLFLIENLSKVKLPDPNF